MFDQLVDGVREASESSLHLQQEMFRHWTRLLLSATPGSVGLPGDLNNRGAQKRWLELGLEMLNRHREALDTTYRSGIQLIEQTFQVTDAKSGDDYRKVVEELWRKLFDLQKQQAESQFRDFQTWFEKSAGLAQDARA
jgi:Rad3-related DNA helicase